MFTLQVLPSFQIHLDGWISMLYLKPFCIHKHLVKFSMSIYRSSLSITNKLNILINKPTVSFVNYKYLVKWTSFFTENIILHCVFLKFSPHNNDISTRIQVQSGVRCEMMGNLATKERNQFELWSKAIHSIQSSKSPCWFLSLDAK